MQRHRAISIHALREEGDTAATGKDTVPWYFYPRPPRGGRLALRHIADEIEKFLSTPSARRATQSCSLDTIDIPISIHALREEGDA